jgi:4-hydroxy-4-methyl-2-oxoglutarate aldolase
MRLTEEEIGEVKKLPTGNVCDANGKAGNMHSAIKPIDPQSKLVGPAVTVRSQPGDNLAMHKAIYEAEPGSVLVIDAHGYTEAGPFGDIMVTACQARGIAGVVLDGACRDSNDIQGAGFPFFARAFNPGGTVKESLGPINETIQCGGVMVKPGDLIVGDRDGVVVVSQEKTREVLKAAQTIFDKEIKVKEMLRQGKTTLEIYGLDKVIEQKTKL